MVPYQSSEVVPIEEESRFDKILIMIGDIEFRYSLELKVLMGQKI